MTGVENTKKMKNDYLNNNYLKPEFDITPDGEVKWTYNLYISRCGINRWGTIERGYCGKTYKFRSCWVLGQEMRAHVCTRCDLRRSIVTEALGRKRDLCIRLAEILKCTPSEAFHQAYANFGYLSEYRKPNLFPMESGLEKIVEIGYTPQGNERLPYRD